MCKWLQITFCTLQAIPDTRWRWPLSTWKRCLRAGLNYLSRARIHADEVAGSRHLTRDVLLLASFPLIALTDGVVNCYDTLRRMKQNVGRNDLRLAALALELSAIVVTDNVRDFARVPGLQWVDWTK